MARISKYKLRDDVLEKLFGLFFEIIGNQDDKNEFNEIINGVFSYNERIMFAKRIAIIYLACCIPLNFCVGEWMDEFRTQIVNYPTL